MLIVRPLVLALAMSVAVMGQAPSLSLTPLYPGCNASLTLTGAPGSPFLIAGDSGPGPISVPGLGQVELDLSPDLFILIDGTTSSLVLDANGNFTLSFQVPLLSAGSLPTPPVYLQALVFDPAGTALSNGVAASVTSPPGQPYTNGTLPAENFLGEGVELADLDNDGDLDAVVANNGALNSRIYINQGGLQAGIIGTYADETVARAGAAIKGALCVAIADIELDGDLDIFLGADDLGGTNESNALYINQGGFQNGNVGDFVLDGTFPGGAFETQSAVFADFDGNGFPDLLAGNGVDVSMAPQPDELWLNSGGMFIAQPTFSGTPFNLGGETDDVVVGLIDADAILDVVLVRDGLDVVLIGDGLGGFTESVNALPGAMFNSTAGAIEDFDGDGDNDVFISNIGAPDQLFLNDGTGSFMPANLPFAPTSTLHLSARAADINGDGDVDIVVATHTLGGGELPYAYINLGGSHAGPIGSFLVQLFLTVPSEIFQDVALGDVDADGDLDLWWASQGFFGPSAQDTLLLSNLCP